jgi:hypothetical protein
MIALIEECKREAIRSCGIFEIVVLGVAAGVVVPITQWDRKLDGPIGPRLGCSIQAMKAGDRTRF